MRKILSLLLTLLLLAGVMSAQADTRPTQVVSTFYPVYCMAANLLQNTDTELNNLSSASTGCLHDYQLQSADMRRLSGADVLLINGAGMEGFLQTVADQFPALVQVDASTGIELLYNEAEAKDNPHLWLSVPNAMTMVSNLAEGLMAAVPAQSDTIAANRDAYLARLSDLNDELHAGVDRLARKDIITFHEAFPYFAREYGLTLVAVMEKEPGEALSAAQLRELAEIIRANNLPPLFVEPQYPTLAAETLHNETGAPIYTLDPLVTGELDDTCLTAYEDGMRRNLAELEKALGVNP